MQANFSIRHGAALDSLPFFFGAGEFVLLVSLVRQQLGPHVIKTLVTSSAFPLRMINTWGLCHFFFGHLLPLIIPVSP